MRIFLKTGFLIIFLAFYSTVEAQVSKLFEPFDCRRHTELSLDEPIIEVISQASIQAILPTIFEEPAITIDTVSGWKNWHTVENFTYGKDRGSLPMITELNALHPYFRDKITALIQRCQAKGIRLAIVETYRTHAKQHEYKTMGKKYTRSGAGKSKHQYGLATDVVPIVDSMAVWNNLALWRKIGVEGEKLGLRWGGRWKHPFDPGHFEWTGGITTYDLTVGRFPPIPKKAEHYPCLEEDIKLLRKYWREWEVDQSSLTRK